MSFNKAIAAESSSAERSTECRVQKQTKKTSRSNKSNVPNRTGTCRSVAGLSQDFSSASQKQGQSGAAECRLHNLLLFALYPFAGRITVSGCNTDHSYYPRAMQHGVTASEAIAAILGRGHVRVRGCCH